MNFQGVGEYILKKTGKIFNPDRLKILTEEQAPCFHKHIPPGNEEVQVLVVLDEAHLFFNARDWAKSDKDHRATFNLATQHRKYFLDIVLISQHFGNIDAQFLRLIEELWRFRDLGKWRFPFPGLSWFRIPFVRFLAIVFDRNGKTILRRYWQPFDKLVGNAYNTRAVSKGSQMSGKVEKIELAKDPVFAARLAKIRKLAGIALIVIALCLTAFLAMVYGKNKVEPDRREFDRIKTENARLKETKTPPRNVATMGDPATAGAPVWAAPLVKPPPPSWLDAPPITEIMKIRSYWEGRGQTTLLAEMDGVTQRVTLGGWVTRGRVMRLTKLNHKMFDVEVSDDSSIRHRMRFVLQDIPLEGATNPNMRQAAQPGLTGPDGNPLGQTVPLQSTSFGGYPITP